MKSYRQGDVYLERIDAIPENAKARPSNSRIILAEGEATGHAHSVSNKSAIAYEESGVTYLEVKSALAMLTHEEHATIKLPRGKYRVIRQREYAPEAPRIVGD